MRHTRAGQVAFVYLGALVAGALLLRDRVVARAVEPVLALGTLVVIGYGLSERMLPGVLAFARSVSAEGRLEQPLTYWNAMGEVAAIGLVLCSRLAGDPSRDRRIRAAAAGAAAPLGMGLYVTFSRGALFACFAGVVSLLWLSPTRAQLRGIVVVAAAAAVAALLAALMPAVSNLSGSLGTRETQGAIALVGLIVIAGAAVLAQSTFVADADGGVLTLPRHTGLFATGLVCAGLALAIAVGSREASGVPLSGGAGRLVTFQSDRYDYWRVALEAFAHEPLIGVGAGGWAVWWLRRRPYPSGAVDAHSLELQTLAELGLIGFAILLVTLGGVALGARDARRRFPGAAPGLVAGAIVWLAHSPLDWDWQMPAVTLIAVVLVGAMLALTELPQSAEPPG